MYSFKIRSDAGIRLQYRQLHQIEIGLKGQQVFIAFVLLSTICCYSNTDTWYC